MKFEERPAYNYKQVKVTPEVARGWLLRNNTNRKLKWDAVLRYKSMLASGYWSGTNGETIKITVEGDLIDGQHRLNAVIELDIPVWLDVKFNCRKEDYKTVDQGVPRSVADNLHAIGYTNPTQVASASRMILSFHAGGFGKVAFPKLYLTNFAEKHPELQALAARVHKAHAILPASPFVAVMWMASQRSDMNKVNEFIQQVITGEVIATGDPALALRNEGLKVGGKRKTESERWFAVSAIAWNAFIKNQKLAKYRTPEVPDVVIGYPYVKGEPLPEDEMEEIRRFK